ncbi:MAG: DUF1080 domain-containing protein [Planctomycetota bacterium]|nr:DUF1080 domain-containing protein [Planctomycetota bacterium]
MSIDRRAFHLASLAALGTVSSRVLASPAAENAEGAGPVASIDGREAGFRSLGEGDFVNVNCKADTWRWKDGLAHCTGDPVGVIRSTKPYTNFELICEWRHLRDAGNSGIFLWTPKASLDRLDGPGLPEGIEVQVLDLGYTAAFEKGGGKAGDVFPVGGSTMTPFAPTAPNGRRSFPSENRSKGVGEWNHYYVRAINGEVRLWVNGREVSGGTDCNPRTGYLCLESEGAPVEFRGLRLRELP